MRKKIEDRALSNTLLEDREAYEALQDSLPDDVVPIKVVTSLCCGLQVTHDCLHPCEKTVNPALGYAFCCVEHQQVFESQLPKTIVEAFYLTVATLNTLRTDLGERFYTDWLPSAHVVISRRLQKPLMICSLEHSEFEAYREAVKDPFAVAIRFRADLHEDVKTLLGHQEVLRVCQTASGKATALEEFDISQFPVTPVCLVSPSLTPRSADQSPSKSKPETPRSNKASPRPASPSVATPDTPPVVTPDTSAVEHSSTFDALTSIIESEEFQKRHKQ